MSTVLTYVMMNGPWVVSFQQLAPSLQRSLHMCYFVISARYLSISMGKDTGVQICWSTKRPYQLQSNIYWIGLIYTT
eukprot:1313788-Prorocentrum_lima.AAC.1